ERAGAAHGPDVAQIRRGARTFPVHAVAGRALTFAVEDRLTPARVAGFPRRRRVEGVHVAEVRDDARDFRGMPVVMMRARSWALDTLFLNRPERRLTPAMPSPVGRWQVEHCAA